MPAGERTSWSRWRRRLRDVDERIGSTCAELTRVVQGIATGVGFLGAGVILRLPDSIRVKGLTTAASIWLTAAVGCAVGAGRHLAAGRGHDLRLAYAGPLAPLGTPHSWQVGQSGGLERSNGSFCPSPMQLAGKGMPMLS